MVSDAKDLNFNEKNYVCFSNSFALARQNLSKLSAIILRVLISNIMPNDEKFFTYCFSVVELSSFIKKNKSNIYHDAPKICRELEKFTVYEKNKEIHVFAFVKYQNGLFYIKLDDRMKPYFLNLEKFYLQYPLETVLYLKNSYSLRMLEIVWARDGLYRHEKSILDFEVSEIREALGCNTKYKSFDSFCRKVITPALIEISLYTDLICKIIGKEKDKNHRRIVTIKIEIHKKPADPGQILL